MAHRVNSQTLKKAFILVYTRYIQIYIWYLYIW